MKNNGIKDRIGIEQRLTCLETKVDEIMNNHIPHLEEKLDRIQWILVISLIGIVANLIEKFL